jgi:anaerobic ribonucleoside-triphosphate reductase activating protein
MLLLAATQFSLTNSSFELYLAGCKGDCPGCHNPELKAFTGEPVTMDTYRQLDRKIQDHRDLIDQVWILGGEPLDSDHRDLARLLQYIDERFRLPIWLWTRYEIGDVPQAILRYCTMVKTGMYRKDLLTDCNIQAGIKLASSNQKLWRFR